MQIPSLSQTAAALLLCGLAAQAGATGTVVIDTYGPGDATDGWPSQLMPGQDLAIAFDIASAATIESILTSIDGVGGITVGILARIGSVPTAGAWLYSTHLSDPWANTPLAPAGWTLAAGSYWLLTQADAGFAGQWQSGTDTPGAAWAFSSSGAWQAVDTGFIGAPATRITVTSAVPEPSTWGLMALGALVVAGARVRRQQQPQG
ncbi:MAG: PEP-CTERM sorting domain-containing protein [Roseateles sp.]|uniref:PEP-CTERM sorting domain-containing protein n=1 Tax=Roseateles sp. TaxID=1971397 RepID=UPI0039E81118